MAAHPLARASRALRRGTSALPRDRRLPLLLRPWAADAGEEAGPGELARDRHLALIEAALFAADEPLTPRRLTALAGLSDPSEAPRLVARLRELYERDGSAFQVEELAGGYQLLTRPEFHPWLARLRRANTDAQLTPAARETLTIVAYRQPVTRADVEAVRGAQSGDVLRQLMEKGLVRIAGHDDSLGRPLLYATTRKFLQVFGLRSLKDLPPAEGLTPPRQEKTSAGPGGEEAGE
jgi:segregation and condensation protein B